MTDFAEHASRPRLRAPKWQTPTWRDALRRQYQVLHALMLHDIKSRFFGNGLGYVVTILWPSAHLITIVVAYYVSGRVAPYGDSRLLYVSTAVMPYITWSYISRFCLMGMIQNRSYLSYPIVKPLDMMLARLALEIVSVTIILGWVILALLFAQADPMPHDPAQAVFGLLSAVLLGVGFGILSGVLVMILPLFALVYILFLIVFWITSGIAIDPERVPDQLAYWLSWNPLLHCTEWIRSAYYQDFPARLLDKQYVLTVGFGALAIGLAAERLLRKYTMR